LERKVRVVQLVLLGARYGYTTGLSGAGWAGNRGHKVLLEQLNYWSNWIIWSWSTRIKWCNWFLLVQEYKVLLWVKWCNWFCWCTRNTKVLLD
jgi:hypothetical protein